MPTFSHLLCTPNSEIALLATILRGRARCGCVPWRVRDYGILLSLLGKCRERQQTLPIHHANLRRPLLVVHKSFEVIGANSSLEDGSYQNAFGNVIDVPADGHRAVLPLVIHGSERVAVANYA